MEELGPTDEAQPRVRFDETAARELMLEASFLRDRATTAMERYLVQRFCETAETIVALHQLAHTLNVRALEMAQLKELADRALGARIVARRIGDPGRCYAVASGGERCELDHGHEGGHAALGGKLSWYTPTANYGAQLEEDERAYDAFTTAAVASREKPNGG